MNSNGPATTLPSTNQAWHSTLYVRNMTAGIYMDKQFPNADAQALHVHITAMCHNRKQASLPTTRYSERPSQHTTTTTCSRLACVGIKTTAAARHLHHNVGLAHNKNHANTTKHDTRCAREAACLTQQTPPRTYSTSPCLVCPRQHVAQEEDSTSCVEHKHEQTCMHAAHAAGTAMCCMHAAPDTFRVPARPG